MSLRIILACLFVVASSSQAHAQLDEPLVAGPGHKVSEGSSLQPTAELESGYVSNVFYEDSGVVGAGVLRLIGHVTLASTSDEEQSAAMELLPEEEGPSKGEPPKVAFKLGGRLQLEQYISGRGPVQKQSNIGGALDLDLMAFPEGTTSFVVKDNLTRDTRPVNFESASNNNRIVNHLLLGLVYKPGGGALQAKVRYENRLDVFESDNSSFANRIQHTVGLRGEWQWLPITRFFADASLGFFGALDSGSAFKASSNPLRLRVGVATALTERTTVRAHIGFGKGFYSAGQDFMNVLYGTEVGFRYSPVGRFTVAFEYDFDDSINANFYRDYAVVAKVDQQVGLVILDARAGARLRGYRGIGAMAGPPSRDDFILDVGLKANYMYRDWLSFSARLSALLDATDYRTNIGDDPSYERVEILGGASAAF